MAVTAVAAVLWMMRIFGLTTLLFLILRIAFLVLRCLDGLLRVCRVPVSVSAATAASIVALAATFGGVPLGRCGAGNDKVTGAR